jgi:hypothetical protein
MYLYIKNRIEEYGTVTLHFSSGINLELTSIELRGRASAEHFYIGIDNREHEVMIPSFDNLDYVS